jgi:shikimate dehydrogenase
MTSLTERADLSTIWLLGDPVAHSMSPLIQNRALQILGVNAIYLAAKVQADDFEQVVRGLPLMGAIGANVTVPHKRRAFQLCDSLSPRAQLMGAVNTLVFREGEVLGDNTDGAGWWTSLQNAGQVRAFEKAVVIGAGGAARAICHTLVEKGIGTIVLLNRTESRAQELKAELLSVGSEACAVNVHGLEAFPHQLEPNMLVVQTTSVGLLEGDCPVPLPASVPGDVVLSELIYGRVTPLMDHFQKLGVKVQDGLGMLVGQGAESLALWLGLESSEVPRSAMMESAQRFLASER